jgi:plastocyanin
MTSAAVLKRIGLIGLLFALCGSVGSARAATIHVVISQVAFKTAEVKATVGDTIEWVNNDIIDHTATAKNGDFDLSIASGKKAQLVLKKAGTFDYYCRLHPNMTARLVVAAAAKR